MKSHLIITLAALSGLCVSLKAQETADSCSIDHLHFVRNGEYMTVEMNIPLSGVQVEANRAILLIPRIVNGNDSVELAPIGIYGRQRYYHYVRNGKSLLSGSKELSYRASHRPDTLAYHEIIPYKEWMNGSQLIIHQEEYGCCNSLMDEQTHILTEYKEKTYIPEFIYVSPKAEVVKSRSLQGSAFIDFPVNRTEIHDNYRNNLAELSKIKATIDSVRNDADIQITAIFIKGYASPEGSYSNNERLAKGRTEALKTYVSQLYDFPKSLISTSFEAEDWAGLRSYVEQSGLPHKADILALINSDREPDAKEKLIRTSYPEDYRQLLEHCYPSLRHSDYRVEYVIRSFQNADEIRRILHSQPQKLSLQEFYMAAQGLEPGSDEFNEIFETAVRLFPNDETANLNAANAAMSRNDLERAENYLSRAGNSPEAIHAREVYAALLRNYKYKADYKY